MKLTKAHFEILNHAQRAGDKGAAESFYQFSGARARVITSLIKEGLLSRLSDANPRITTARLHLTDAGRSMLTEKTK